MDNKYYKIAALIALSTSAGNGFAQMNNVVEVENSFAPAIKDADKIDILPHVVETRVQHNSVEYATDKQITLKTGNGNVDLESRTMQEKQFRNGYVSVGGGNGGNLRAVGLLRLSLTPKDIMKAEINFGGHKSKVENSQDASADWESRFYRTTGAIGYEHKLTEESSLSVNASLESDVFNYQFTVPQMESDKQHNWKGDICATLSPYSFNSFSVGGSVRFNHFSQKYPSNLPDKMSKNVLGADIILGYRFNKNASIELEVSNELCNSSFATSPRLTFGYDASDAIYLYASAGTGKKLQTLDRLTEFTPYFMLDSAEQQCKSLTDNISARAGARIKTADIGAVNLSAGYEMQKDRAEFSNIRGVDFIEGNHIEANLNFSGKLFEKLHLDIKNQWNKWTATGEDEDYKITWRPVLNIDWRASYDITRKLNAGAGFLLQTFDKDDLYYERPVTTDLSADISYTIRQGISIYAQGRNLLNSKHDIYIGHRAPGINATAGIRCTF